MARRTVGLAPRHAMAATPVELAAFTPAPSCIRRVDTITRTRTVYTSSGGASAGGYDTSTTIYLFGGGFIDGTTAMFGTPGGVTLPHGYDSACFPQGGIMWEYLYGNAYFAPGVCPQSYSQVPTTSITVGVGTTVCCPIGYSFANLHGSYDIPFCESTFSTVLYRSTNPAPTTLATGGVTIPVSGTATVTAVGFVFEEYHAEGLSTGAKAGIGVGVSVAVIAFALALYWILWRRRKSRHSRSEAVAPEKPELEAVEKKAVIATNVELGNTSRRPDVAELSVAPDMPAVQELDPAARTLPTRPEPAGQSAGVLNAAVAGPGGEKRTAVLGEDQSQAVLTLGNSSEQGKRTAEYGIREQGKEILVPAADSCSDLLSKPTAELPPAGKAGSSFAAATSDKTDLERRQLQAELESIRDEQERIRMGQLERRERQIREKLDRIREN